jgi:hypothetical protein
MRFSSSVLRSILALVTKAHKEGPLQDWQKPPTFIKKTGNRAKTDGMLRYTLPQFRQDPKMLWASDIAQSLAEGTLEALHLGSLGVALLRAKTAASYESRFCARPGVYQELLFKVSELLEMAPHGGANLAFPTR